jgi:hypothetical protein
MRSLPLLAFCVTLLLSSHSNIVAAQTGSSYAEHITSRDVIGEKTAPTKSLKYRKKWAVIIGIDYVDGESFGRGKRSEIPRLANARRDAKALRDKLIQKYGYLEEHVTLLLESEATAQRITGELQSLHGNKVNDEDSVLVFFAGHGAKQTDEDGNVVVYPHDVKISEGSARQNMLYVQEQLITMIDKSPARHKILILDSCYSGEVFSQKLNLAASSARDDGKDETLFSQPGFQVVTSCRGYQEASDGSGINSPFTQALLRGLEMIPANERQPPRIWTGRLMRMLDEEFYNYDYKQRPSYRSLSGGQGEFTFFPDFDNATFGAQSHGEQLSVAMLRATSPGVKGNWWFDEMPWFMPSIRSQILSQSQDLSRSNEMSASIDVRTLRKIANGVLDLMQSKIEASNNPIESGADPKVSSDELLRLVLRARHLNSLLKKTDPAARLKTLEAIETDLLDVENQKVLEATDLHLLAVVQHAIGKKVSFDSYEDAIARYQMPSQGGDPSKRISEALESLCHADYGDSLSTIGGKQSEIINQFNLALTTSRQTPDAFRVYCLCRLAKTYLRDNRWEDARIRLNTAKQVVNDFDSRSYLAAFVHNSDAWFKMIQWNVSDAEKAFLDSNQVLLPLIIDKADPEARKDAKEERLDERSDAFRQSPDFGAKVAYFHNLHGLAMATRYRGEGEPAASQFRNVIAMIEDALFQLRGVSDETASQAENEMSLLDRFVNSQERLGDCNLLGNPATRDLAEAADDYRRAMSRVHRLPTTRRSDLKAQLFYKQALAFALPSPVQDCELALEMCHHADQILEKSEKSSSGLLLALRTLTTPTVEMLASASDYQRPSLQNDKKTESSTLNVTENMRTAIHTLRDLAGTSAHRDQLELMMFASRNLIEYGNETVRLKKSEDVELLLSLNRLALNRASDSEIISLGSQSFLRQYYDTAFTASLDATPRDAKRLLEIQYEATTGTPYGKLQPVAKQNRRTTGSQNVRGPVLAIFQVQDTAYMICDIPRSEGICIPLTDICTSEELAQACGKESKTRMRLPTKVAGQLDRFFSNQSDQNCYCRLQFMDPVSLLGYEPVAYVASKVNDEVGNDETNPTSGEPVSVAGQFPFNIPDEWKLMEIPSLE